LGVEKVWQELGNWEDWGDIGGWIMWVGGKCGFSLVFEGLFVGCWMGSWGFLTEYIKKK
jgi:hypothetical protein